MLGADSDRWNAYRSEAEALQERLEQLGEHHARASDVAEHVESMLESVGAALGLPGSDLLARERDIEPLALPERSRRIMQRVAD